MTPLRHSGATRTRPEPAETEAGFTLIELMVVLLIIAILLAIAIPTFLGVANSAGDRAAQSNLTNALTEAKALYQNGATYAPGTPAVAMTTATLTASAPEFSWTTGGCFTSSTANCMSVQVVDASAAGDGQGIVVAAYSPKTQSCWYGVDLESAPAQFTDSGGTPAYVSFNSSAHPQSGSATTAGVFYAHKSGKGTSNAAVSATTCNASWVTSTQTVGFFWGLSYSSPGAAA